MYVTVNLILVSYLESRLPELIYAWPAICFIPQ